MHRRGFLSASSLALLQRGAKAQTVPTAQNPALSITEGRICLVAIGGRHPVGVKILTDQGVTGVGDASVAYGAGALRRRCPAAT